MKVSFYARLRPIVGQRSVEITLPEGATVEQLVDEMVRRWPALREVLLDDRGKLARHVQLCVNGRAVRYLENGLSTVLTSAHRVDVFPAVAGGSGPTASRSLAGDLGPPTPSPFKALA